MYKTHALYIVLEGLGWSQDHPKPSNKSIAKDSQASKGPLSGKQRQSGKQRNVSQASQGQSGKQRNVSQASKGQSGKQRTIVRQARTVRQAKDRCQASKGPLTSYYSTTFSQSTIFQWFLKLSMANSPSQKLKMSTVS